MSFPDKRPALGDIAVGDRVIVFERQRPRTRFEAVVTKVARVWLTVETPPGERYPRTWRMRRDGQNVGGDYPNDASFRTPEQDAWFQTIAAAQRFLAARGIRPVRPYEATDTGDDLGPDWSTPSRLVRLAGMIAQAERDG